MVKENSRCSFPNHLEQKLEGAYPDHYMKKFITAFFNHLDDHTPIWAQFLVWLGAIRLSNAWFGARFPKPLTYLSGFFLGLSLMFLVNALLSWLHRHR